MIHEYNPVNKLQPQRADEALSRRRLYNLGLLALESDELLTVIEANARERSEAARSVPLMEYVASLMQIEPYASFNGVL